MQIHYRAVFRVRIMTVIPPGNADRLIAAELTEQDEAGPIRA
jgi:hypothetical protein